MKANHELEQFATTVNDLDSHLPKSRGRCFDIGIWGGCGPSCAAFVDGECDIPCEIPKADIISEHGLEDATTIMNKYKKGTWERL